MKKIGYFGCLLLIAALMLTGCAGTADTLASPTPGASVMPQNSSMPDAQTSPMLTTQMPILSDMQEGMNAMMGLTSLTDVQRVSEEMEDAVEQLSEVDDAYVIAHKDTALVGLKMNGQYQGQVDERLQKMVLSRVQTVEKSISGVAVTNDPEKVKQIEQLTEQLENANDLSQVTAAMDAMLNDLNIWKE